MWGGLSVCSRLSAGARSALILLLFAATAFAADGDLQKAQIGDLKLQSGQVIRDCTIGYRTYGALNADKSNAVLFPTWFTGRSESLKSLVGPAGIINPSGLFIVLVDALGDGVSSSPSNSKLQPRMQFPQFTIRDMVESQHQLLTQKLGIQHLRAVMGISMGGMQTFAWITAYPGFMDKAIPIVGSPKLSSIDLLLWNAEKHAIEAGADWKHGNYQTPPVETMRAVADIHEFALTTPARRVHDTPAAAFDQFLKSTEADTLKGFDANDWLRQLEAMIAQDVGPASATKAKLLIVVSAQDHMVNPTSALEFAKQAHAETLVLESDCGHLATGCESAHLSAAVNKFLH
jgi:homoserine O-acetyltransferase